MARKKVPFQAWESRADGGYEKRYFRLGATIMASEAMLSLSNSAFRVYCHMRITSGGKRSFTFPYSKYKIFMTRPTFVKARDELVEKGFVDVVQNNKNLRKANIYCFSERWKTI
ncbi:hypothetical protein AALB51_20455 [Lachnospiraceae bacterium 62-26]